ncbi:MAG: Gp49 family protein [Alphaproteobacteria bacterium]
METVEEQIQRVGATTAPRITPQHIEEQIADEVYCMGSEIGTMKSSSLASLLCLTICVLVMKNGFTVVGKSACASPENYNEEVGRRVAREDAVKQIWALEGYQLRTRLAVGPAPT